MEKTSFWSRVGDMLRRPGRAVGSRGDGRSAGLSGTASMTDSDTGDPGIRPPIASKRHLARREAGGREPLEEGFTRVVGLVESIQAHFKLQDERAERMAASFDRIAESLAQVPEASQTQVESLREIREQLQAGTAWTKRIEDSLSELPRMADAQRETMVSMGRQLEVLREADDRGTEVMGELGQSMSRLEDAAKASTGVLKDMHTDSAAREERMTGLVREQTRQLMRFALAAIVLAAVAALVSVVALLR